MSRAGRFPAVVTLVGAVALSVTGCGSGTSHSSVTAAGTARTDAERACTDLLNMGEAIVEQRTVTSAAAVQTLSSAVTSADSAANLDRRWTVLDKTVVNIRSYLEHGPRRGLPGSLDDLAAACQPLVSPAPGSPAGT